LQVNTSAPAAPFVSARVRRSSVARRRVARVQPDHLALAHGRADRDRPRVRVGAEQPAHEEVAAVVVGLRLLGHDPDEQPVGDHVALALAERVDDLAHLVERRHARERRDHVPVRAGDGHLRPQRGGALRDARQHVDVVEAHADGARLEQLLAVEQRPGPVQGARARDAADDRHARRPLGEVAQQPVGREAVGIGQQHDRRRAVEVGQPADLDPVLEALRLRVERLRAPAVEGGGPDDDGGPALDLARVAEDAARAAADDALGQQRLVHPLERRLGGGEVLARREHDDEVRGLALEPRAGERARLDRSDAGVGGGGEAAPDPDRHASRLLVRERGHLPELRATLSVR
jgi:hypothetical protein